MSTNTEFKFTKVEKFPVGNTGNALTSLSDDHIIGTAGDIYDTDFHEGAYQSEINRYLDNNFSSYLPLTGGVIKGTLEINDDFNNTLITLGTKVNGIQIGSNITIGTDNKLTVGTHSSDTISIGPNGTTGIKIGSGISIDSSGISIGTGISMGINAVSIGSGRNGLSIETENGAVNIGSIIHVNKVNSYSETKIEDSLITLGQKFAPAVRISAETGGAALYLGTSGSASTFTIGSEGIITKINFDKNDNTRIIKLQKSSKLTGDSILFEDKDTNESNEFNIYGVKYPLTVLYRDVENNPVEFEYKAGNPVEGDNSSEEPGNNLNTIDLSRGVYYATTSKTATRVSNELTIRTGEGEDDVIIYNGQEKQEINISPEGLGMAPADHDHLYAAANEPGGDALKALLADTATKVSSELKITVGENDTKVFDGSNEEEITITTETIGAATANHDHDNVYSKLGHTHDNYAVASNDSNYGGWAENAVHSESADTATTAIAVSSELKITVGESETEVFDGSNEVEITITPDTIGAAPSGHNHDNVYSKLGHTHDNYAASSNKDGVADRASTAVQADTATTATSVSSDLKITVGESETKVFNGSNEVEITITPDTIGAAPSGHNHDNVYSKLGHEHDNYAVSSNKDGVADNAVNAETAETANSLKSALSVTVTNEVNNTSDAIEFDGSNSEEIEISATAIGAALSNHNHANEYAELNHTHDNYATSSNKDGVADNAVNATYAVNAKTADGLKSGLTIKVNGNEITFDGTNSEEIEITTDFDDEYADKSHNHDELYAKLSEDANFSTWAVGAVEANVANEAKKLQNELKIVVDGTESVFNGESSETITISTEHDYSDIYAPLVHNHDNYAIASTDVNHGGWAENAIHSESADTASVATKVSAELILNVNNQETRFNGSNEQVVNINTIDYNNVTYAELVEMRNNSELQSGAKYCITDYETTVSGSMVNVANHKFNVIVEALNENTLSETARVIKSEDTILSKFEALETLFEWKDINNWLDVTNTATMPQEIVELSQNAIAKQQGTQAVLGGNVIKVAIHGYTGDYTNPAVQQPVIGLGASLHKKGTDELVAMDYGYNKSEYYIQVPETYTSDTDLVIRFYIDSDASTATNGICGASAYEGRMVKFDYFENVNLNSWDIKYCLDNDTTRFNWANADGKGVIYYMKDDKGNECPYDFKNILFENDGALCYTFDYYIDGVHYDGSVKTDVYNCYNNVIKPVFIYSGSNNPSKQYLNAIVFRNTSVSNECYCNIFDEGSNNITFGSDCNYNTFGVNSNGIKIGTGCNYNTFGTDSNAFILDNNCSYNTFNTGCSDITLGQNCSNNILNNCCQSITLGNECESNVFNVSCSSIHLGNNCCSNVYGNNCNNILIAKDSTGEQLLNYVINFTFSNDCRDIVLWKTINTGNTSALKNYKVVNSLNNETYELVGIEESLVNNNYTTVIEKNSENEVVQYVPGDQLTSGIINDVTYAELVELRNAHELVPGVKYRIIDYETTTNGNEGTSVAGHKFDIMIDALDTSHVSETAQICHARYIDEEYSYDITNPYSGNSIIPGNWSNVPIASIPAGINEIFTATSDSHVRKVEITRWNNQNITCTEGPIKVIWQYTAGANQINILGVELVNVNSGAVVSADYHIGSTGHSNINNIYTLSAPSNGIYKFVYYIDAKTQTLDANCTVYTFRVYDYFENCNLSSWEIRYSLDNDSSRFRWTKADGKGVIYYMRDEYDNIANYDFKNILIDGKYTFSYEIDGHLYDGTVRYGRYCYQNRIGNDRTNPETGSLMGMPKIYFINTTETSKCYSNTVADDCWTITFGNNCYENTVKTGCERLTLGNNCYNNLFSGYSQNIRLSQGCHTNTFGTECYDITFGQSCYSNRIGSGCRSITFESQCNLNILEQDCRDISLNEQCTNNTFNRTCTDNTLDKYSSSNTFNDNCTQNRLGESCSSNTFGIECADNNLAKNCSNNIFGEDCNSNILSEGCTENIFGNQCNSNMLLSNCTGNVMKNHCSSNQFGSNCTENSFGDTCISNLFSSNCSSNQFGHNCSYNEFGINCNSNIFGHSSSSNVFGKSCYSNKFDYNFISNHFGDWCFTNTFSNNCKNNIMGNNCYSNTFKDYCWDNKLGNVFHANTLGVDCSNIKVIRALEDETPVDCVSNMVIGNYSKNLTIYPKEIVTTGVDIVPANYLTNFHIDNDMKNKVIRLEGTADDLVNRKYITTIGENSFGEIVQRCLLDNATASTVSTVGYSNGKLSITTFNKETKYSNGKLSLSFF